MPRHVVHVGSWASQISWTRAARTDKGVSAVGQVVALKLLIEGDDGLLSRINAELPPDIHIMGAVRVVNGFDARRNCDRRRYEYLLPSCAFNPLAFRDRTSVAQAAAAGAVGPMACLTTVAVTAWYVGSSEVSASLWGIVRLAEVQR